MHEYMKRVHKVLADGLIDHESLNHLLISHDSHCAIYRDGTCSCDPIITIETDSGKAQILADGSLSNEGINECRRQK